MADMHVDMGNIAIGKSRDNLLATGVGSCLVIALYCPKHQVGALAHAMLPAPPPSETKPEDTRYVDTAIDEMLARMGTKSSQREDLEAKLMGGANLFAAFASDIGAANVATAKEKLGKEGIKIVGESVGGSQGRSVEFCVGSGIVTVKIRF